MNLRKKTLRKKNAPAEIEKKNAQNHEKRPFLKNVSTGGKPSTWFPPERLVEQSEKKEDEKKKKKKKKRKRKRKSDRERENERMKKR